ncbi:MAG: ATP-binding cassette domain-containing protein [Desulfurococcales archaeon]|nr:ATP-binding cassette domain-containing protein [Desulfurococcales archaeon]
MDNLNDDVDKLNSNYMVIARNLVKVYNGLKAVDNVSFEIRRGELFSLLGPNGAGKTTTIKMLSTLLKPTSGDAWIGGYSVLKNPEAVRRLIGLVPQDLTADDEMTGWDNVYIQARLYGLPKREAEERTREILDYLGLLDAAKRKVSTYSGGMRRKLEIAMSLVHNPRVLFMDEPTLGLDVQSRRSLWGYIEDLKKRGVTILLTTHYMDEAEALSDRVAIIDKGKIVALGSPEELKSRIKGESVYIELRDPGLLADVAGILERELNLKPQIVNGRVTVRVSRADVALPDIIRVLDDAPLKSINIVRATLEEVFIELTGKTLSSGEEALDSFKYRRMLRGVR